MQKLSKAGIGAAALALFMPISIGAQNATPASDSAATAKIEASVSSDTLTGAVDGGESAYGCLGCIVGLGGFIVKIYPESDLNRFQIQPKDQIVGIDDHKFHFLSFQKECLGMPGSEIMLDVLHKGELEKIAVRRVDSRLLASRAHRYKNLSEHTKYW